MLGFLTISTGVDSSMQLASCRGRRCDQLSTAQKAPSTKCSLEFRTESFFNNNSLWLCLCFGVQRAVDFFNCTSEASTIVHFYLDSSFDFP